jgi:hypothetical protein
VNNPSFAEQLPLMVFSSLVPRGACCLLQHG